MTRCKECGNYTDHRAKECSKCGELLLQLRIEKESVRAMRSAVIQALDGATDYEGLPPSDLNYLQCIRKLRRETEER